MPTEVPYGQTSSTPTDSPPIRTTGRCPKCTQQLPNHDDDCELQPASGSIGELNV